MNKVSVPHFVVAALVAGALCTGLSLPTEAASPLPPSVVSPTSSTPTLAPSLNNGSMIIQVGAVKVVTPSGSIKKVAVPKR